jgi:hypothetical protein
MNSNRLIITDLNLEMNLTRIIYSAVMGSSKEAQKQGERALLALREQHPDQFLVECAAITKDEKNE